MWSSERERLDLPIELPSVSLFEQTQLFLLAVRLIAKLSGLAWETRKRSLCSSAGEMVQGDEAATVPSSAFFVENGDHTDVEQGLRNGSQQANGTVELRKDKAELLSMAISRPGADVQLMEPVPKDKQLTLVFPNISAWVPDLFGPNSAAGEGNLVSKSWKKLTKRKGTRDSKAKDRQVQLAVRVCSQVCVRSFYRCSCRHPVRHPCFPVDCEHWSFFSEF